MYARTAVQYEEGDRTVRVMQDGLGDFESIAAAVDAASTGALGGCVNIEIEAGTYSEGVVVDCKPQIRLVARGDVTWRAPEGNHCLVAHSVVEAWNIAFVGAETGECVLFDDCESQYFECSFHSDTGTAVVLSRSGSTFHRCKMIGDEVAVMVPQLDDQEGGFVSLQDCDVVARSFGLWSAGNQVLVDGTRIEAAKPLVILSREGEISVSLKNVSLKSTEDGVCVYVESQSGKVFAIGLSCDATFLGMEVRGDIDVRVRHSDLGGGECLAILSGCTVAFDSVRFRDTNRAIEVIDEAQVVLRDCSVVDIRQVAVNVSGESVVDLKSSSIEGSTIASADGSGRIRIAGCLLASSSAVPFEVEEHAALQCADTSISLSASEFVTLGGDALATFDRCVITVDEPLTQLTVPPKQLRLSDCSVVVANKQDLGRVGAVLSSGETCATESSTVRDSLSERTDALYAADAGDASALPAFSRDAAAPSPTRPLWGDSVADEATLRVLVHLERHGVVTESELISILGSPRAARRFALDLESVVQGLPFNVAVESMNGGKRYVRRGR